MTSEKHKIITGLVELQPKIGKINIKQFALALAAGTLNFKDTALAEATEAFYSKDKRKGKGKGKDGRVKALRNQLKGFNHHYLVLPDSSYENGDWDDIHIVSGLYNPDVMVYRRATKQEIISHFLKS